MAANGKVALITGANKGIGLETARQLGKLGFTVLLGARDPERGAAAAAQLQAEGIAAQALRLDVTREADRQAAAKYVSDQFGKLDALVNNAGIMVEGKSKPSSIPLDTLRQTFETDFFSTVALTQELLPLLRQSPAGRIVNVSSQLGSLQTNATNDLGDYAILGYNSSKAALNMFTILLAKELKGTPIKVNSAHPGWVKTDMGGAAAPLEIVDGAKTSVWLATLPADGPTGGFFHMQKPLPW